MPPLSNPRREKFVQGVAAGHSATESYRRAGYRSKGNAAEVGAHLILRNSKVAARLAELQAKTAKRNEITRDSLVAQLEQARQVALAADPPQVSAAVAATMGIGKLLGLVLDRSELTVIRDKPSPVPTRILELSEEDWKKSFANRTVTRHNDR